METHSVTGEKKALWQDDRMLVCGMLVVYGVCILVVVGAVFFGLNRRVQTIALNATATAVAESTQQAQATMTAAVHATEQAGYEFVEHFDTNLNLWRSRREDNEYWKGIIKVTEGYYIWEVTDVKETFASWADFPRTNYMKDFDVYVDTKISNSSLGDACSGLLFRVDPAGWDSGGFSFVLCNDSSVRISYHTETDGWERIANRLYFDYSSRWNRLEIKARGSHFSFSINGEPIYEMDDNRKKAGGLALVVDINEKAPATIWFDNFGLQRR